MVGILTYLQYFLGRLLYRIRGHDAGQIVRTAAFRDLPQPNMKLEATECGPSGSLMLPYHTCLAADTKGNFPELHWTPPSKVEVKEYVLISEDIDPPIPRFVVMHGLFYAIPASTTEALPDDVEQDENTKDHITQSGWRYVPNLLGTSYIGPAPPLGHGIHRYIFTIIALSEPLQFDRPDRVSKKQIKEAIVGKVIGWGQWIGHFERPWPN
ncbi:phosphatidylethanolamine-binding protein [Aspergillus coremiiformis]|uniref:Phosphatidylethanolamine-binding protein n=1 Tax=Aspergillus coremiiformis TaxID=138285 RepID=A0A5N6Z2F8_9EURO|nr:phosphatidylethanolamine-binding protein [Aspergillus coremiiformis]